MNTGSGKDWFRDSAFWEEMFPFLFPEKRFEETGQQLDKALLLAEPPGKQALDLCCGPGRFSIELAARGYRVTAVDITDYLMDIARERAEATGVRVEWVRADMRDFRRPVAYDLILNMFTSFGYFQDPEDDIQVLTNVLESLRPGGVFLMETMSKERLARIYQPTGSTRIPDGRILVQGRQVVDDWSTVLNEWILIREGNATTFEFQHRLYSARELQDRLRQVGFVGIAAYGGFDGEDYGPEADHLIMVARRPLTEGG